MQNHKSSDPLKIWDRGFLRVMNGLKRRHFSRNKKIIKKLLA